MTRRPTRSSRSVNDNADIVLPAKKGTRKRGGSVHCKQPAPRPDRRQRRDLGGPIDSASPIAALVPSVPLSVIPAYSSSSTARRPPPAPEAKKPSDGPDLKSTLETANAINKLAGNGGFDSADQGGADKGADPVGDLTENGWTPARRGGRVAGHKGLRET